MEETNDDMDKPGGVLDAAQPDAELLGQHTSQSEKRKGQETCHTAGGVHTGGHTKQDRPSAGAGMGESHGGEDEAKLDPVRHRHRPPSVGIELFDREEKRSKVEREEKKRETGTKPLNTNMRNAWRCGDHGIQASRPQWNEIKRAKGMARRIKQNQHWAGVCVGMAMAQVYIEPITLEPGAAVEGPANHCEPFKFFAPGWVGGRRGEGGRHSQDDKEKAKQSKEERKKERIRPLSKDHKNKRQKLKQLELGQLMWGAPDKDG